MIRPCSTCPWRVSNHGKAHKLHWYSKKNITRLWNQIRRGADGQSCHMTDTRLEEHVQCGAKDTGKIQECAGSIIIIHQEIQLMVDDKGYITDESILKYLEKREKGLTKKGILYWLVQRIAFGDVPYIGDIRLPEVEDLPESEVSLPVYLKE